MKIRYNSTLWNKGTGLCGLPQKVNWEFEFAGTRRCIPVIYRFPKGIVFDIITFLDKMKLREYFMKYESIEKELTPSERRCAKQEHPYQSVPLKEIWINGKPVEDGFSSSSAISVPREQEDDSEKQGDNLDAVRKAYKSVLNGATCFACERVCVPYPKAESVFQTILRFFRLEKVKSLKLCTHDVQWFHPLDISFQMSEKDVLKDICFKHPVTGIKHTLYFQSMVPMELPFRGDENRRLHLMHAMYEIDPPLPDGETLMFASSFEYSEPSGDIFLPRVVSSVGIIGGADGPTSVFIANGTGKNALFGQHGLPLYSCLSVPGFKKTDNARFVLEGINIRKYKGKDYDFI